MYKELLLMRTRGLSGPLLTKHKGVPGLSKSIGNAVGGGIVTQVVTYQGAPVTYNGDEVTYRG
jgi:hypothetical protein